MREVNKAELMMLGYDAGATYPGGKRFYPRIFDPKTTSRRLHRTGWNGLFVI